MSENKKPLDYSRLNFFNPENASDRPLNELLERENNTFPNRPLNKKELQYMVNVVGGKMKKYMNHPCSHYMEKYYSHLNKVLLSKNQEKMLNDYSESLKYIQYFSLCWNEKRNESVFKKSDN
jgi:hypothetical protein